MDVKEFPENVDVCLVEGPSRSEDDLERIHIVRARTKVLVAFGDCAVTSNVPGMRNPIGPGPLLDRAYLENADPQHDGPRPGRARAPADVAAGQPLRGRRRVPAGLPAHADIIYTLLDDLLSGRTPAVAGARFGR